MLKTPQGPALGEGLPTTLNHKQSKQLPQYLLCVKHWALRALRIQRWRAYTSYTSQMPPGGQAANPDPSEV